MSRAGDPLLNIILLGPVYRPKSGLCTEIVLVTDLKQVKPIRRDRFQGLLHLVVQVREMGRIVFVKVQSDDVLRSIDGVEGFPPGRADGRVTGLIRVVGRVPVVNDALLLFGVIGDMVSASWLIFTLFNEICRITYWVFPPIRITCGTPLLNSLRLAKRVSDNVFGWVLFPDRSV